MNPLIPTNTIKISL